MHRKTLLVGSRKGLLTFESTPAGWRVRGSSHLGIPVAYACRDPRHGTLWASLEHGHYGAKLSRSNDGGETWDEVAAPAYPEGERIFNPFDQGETREQGRPAVLENIWVIEPGPADQPQRIYLGTNPGGLFVSDDGGESFELLRPLWDHPSRPVAWFGGGRDTAGIHSIVVDSRDSARMWIGVSCAGVFETTDGGDSWRPRNQGLIASFLPDPKADVGHDPHFIMPCAADPDVLWQQNHCGVFRSTDGAATWDALHHEEGPVRFGFPIAAHAQKRDTAWVVPAVNDDMRIAVAGRLVVCRTEDGGRNWTELREGLPQENAYDVVYRHALDIDGDTLAFGSTTGNLYVSEDGGESWACIGNNLPPIYSVRFAA